MIKFKLFSVGFFLVVFSTNTALAQDSWTQGPDMPTPKTCHCVEMVNGKIYTIGGSQGIAAVVEEYDPVTDTWTRKSDMPTERGYISCSVANGKIYVTGGYTPKTIATVEEYDPATDTWSTKSSMISARWGHVTATVNEKIYVLGGAEGWPDKMVYTIEEYDPMTDTWSLIGGVQTARWMPAYTVMDEKIYVIGGHDVDETSAALEVFDPATGNWTTKSFMPTPRWACSAGMVNGKIYVFGGGDVYPPDKTYSTVEEYDPVSDSWSTKTPMPSGKMGISPSSVTTDGKIYVIGGGGIAEGIGSNTVNIYDPGTGTGIENDISKPANFHLHQNYPNPFNLSTTIDYSLPKADFATIKLYNLAGQVVAILTDSYHTAGDHQITLKAEGLLDAVYFYTLQTSEFSEIRKLILQ